MSFCRKTHAIVTFGTGDSLKCLEITKQYNQRYCNHYGIHYHIIDNPETVLYPKYVNTLDRAPQTLKFSALLYFLSNTVGEYDYVWWCDTDVILFNRFNICDMLASNSDGLLPLYSTTTLSSRFIIFGGLFCLKVTPDNISLLEDCAFNPRYMPQYYKSTHRLLDNNLDEDILSIALSRSCGNFQYVHPSTYIGQMDITFLGKIPNAVTFMSLDNKKFVFNPYVFPYCVDSKVTCAHIFGAEKILNIHRCTTLLKENKLLDY